MTDLALTRAAARQIDPYGDPVRMGRGLLTLQARLRRRARARAAAVVTTAIAAAVIAAWQMSARVPRADALADPAVAMEPARQSSAVEPRPATTPAAPAIDDAPVRGAAAPETAPATAPDHVALRVTIFNAVFSVSRSGTTIQLRDGALFASPPREPRRRRAPARPAAPVDPVGDLLDAADAARREGRGTAAAEALRAAAEHDDPRRQLAWFTLGKVLLDEPGRAGEAADAFAAARDGGDGPLAEDALAREVEARRHAGQHARARALARAYLAAYPDGHHRDAVEAWADR